MDLTTFILFQLIFEGLLFVVVFLLLWRLLRYEKMVKRLLTGDELDQFRKLLLASQAETVRFLEAMEDSIRRGKELLGALKGEMARRERTHGEAEVMDYLRAGLKTEEIAARVGMTMGEVNLIAALARARGKLHLP